MKKIKEMIYYKKLRWKLRKQIKESILILNLKITITVKYFELFYKLRE